MNHRVYEREVLRAAPPEVMTTLDVATLLDCTPATARKWIRTGLLPATILGGRYYLRRRDVLAAIRPRRHPTPRSLVSGARPPRTSVGPNPSQLKPPHALRQKEV